MPINLLSFFGLDARLQKLRAVAGEGVLALEDRISLAYMEWEEEKRRLKMLLILMLALLGLTIVALTIASMAIVVQFWDTPYRVGAAWVVAGAWLLVWACFGTVAVLLLRQGRSAFEPIRHELTKDWDALTATNATTPARSERRLDKQNLLERIARQRERLAGQPQTASTASTAASTALLANPPFPRSATMRTVRNHPVAAVAVVGVAVATIAAIGPRRVVRAASWLLPLLLRHR